MLEPSLKLKGSSLSTGLFHRDGSQKTWDLVLALPCAVLGRAWSSFSGKRRGWRRYAWGPAMFYGSTRSEWPCSLIHKQWRKQKSQWDCLVPKATALSLWVHIRPTAAGAHVSAELSQLALSRGCVWGGNPRAVLGKEGGVERGWPGQHGSE